MNEKQPRKIGMILGMLTGLSFLAGGAVELTQPLPGTEFTAPAVIPFAVTANPSAPAPVKLELLTDGNLVGTVTNVLSGVWPALETGDHALAVRATFSDGSIQQSVAVPIFLGPAERHLAPNITSASVKPFFRPIVLPTTITFTVFAGDPNPTARLESVAMFLNGTLFTEDTPTNKTGPTHIVYTYGVTNYSVPGDLRVTFQARNNFGILTTTNVVLPLRRPDFYWHNITWGLPTQIPASFYYLDDEDNLYGLNYRMGIIQRPNGERINFWDDSKKIEITAVSLNGHFAGLTVPVIEQQPWLPYRYLNGMIEPLTNPPNCRTMAINRRGDVLLLHQKDDGSATALHWIGDSTQELLGFPAGSTVTPRGMNDATDTVGFYNPPSGEQIAFLWHDGVVLNLTNSAGGILCQATSINNSGTVVGSIGDDTFRWKAGKMDILSSVGFASTYPRAINDNGWIIGVGMTNNHTVALLERGHGWEILGEKTPDWNNNLNYFPYAINSVGTILVNEQLFRPVDVPPPLFMSLETYDRNYLKVFPFTPFHGLNILNQASPDLLNWTTQTTNFWIMYLPDSKKQEFFRAVGRPPGVP